MFPSSILPARGPLGGFDGLEAVVIEIGQESLGGRAVRADGEGISAPIAGENGPTGLVDVGPVGDGEG